MKTFLKDGSIKNKWSVLLKSEKQSDIDLRNELIEEAKARLKERGNADPTELEINDLAGIAYNAKLIIENFNRAPKRTALAKRTKLAEFKEDAYNLINDFYDTEINRLKKMDPESTLPFAHWVDKDGQILAEKQPGAIFK